MTEYQKGYRDGIKEAINTVIWYRDELELRGLPHPQDGVLGQLYKRLEEVEDDSILG